MLKKLVFVNLTAHKLMEAKPLGQLLIEIMSRSREIMEAEASSLLIYDETDNRLHFTVATGEKEAQIKGQSIAMGEGIAGWVAQEKQPLLIADCYADSRFNPEFDRKTGFTTNNMLSVPLLSKDKLVGVLQVINHIGSDPFCENDIMLISALASQCAIAVENARLLDKLSEYNQTLEHRVAERTRELSRKNLLIEEQVERLKELDKEKMDFFRFVTHEVKSPVNTVQSAIETTLMVEGEQMNARIRGILERALARTHQVIDTVKDLAEMTKGSMPAQKDAEIINVIGFLEKILDDELGDNPRNLDVQFDSGPDDLNVRTYPQLLEKILANLISNAIRYNKEQGQLNVALQSGSSEYTIDVADTGIGISPEGLEKIFDEFYRTPEAKTHTAIGTGLGMAIVKKFVDRLGGRITVDSTIGEGTCFSLTLPRT